MQVRLLGAVELQPDASGVAVPLAPKQRALLALLALADGAVVTTDQLLTALWGDEPPDTGVKALRFHVSRLRKALPREALQTRPAGYALVGVDCDATQFRRHVAAARAAAAGADDCVFRRAAVGALGVWTGATPLADVRNEPFADAVARGLEEERDELAEQLIAARLDEGPPGAVVAELERLVAEAPLRERRWELLCLALYRSGRQADALAAYQRLRRLLVDELGVEPSAPLRDLEGRILRQDPTLDGPPVRSRAAPSATAPVGAAVPPALRDARTGDPLVGRDEVLDELRHAWKRATVGEGGIVFVNGPAGIGKTRLTAELAHAAGETGALVAVGRCDEGGDLPFAPWAELLGGLVQVLPPDAVDGHLARHGGALGAVVPAIRRRVDAPSAGLGGELDRLALFEAVLDLLVEAATDVAPVLLVLEDAHWADPSSLQLLRHVGKRSAEAAVLIVTTVRTTDIDADSPLVAIVEALARQPRTRAVELGGLTAAEVAAVVSATIDAPTGDAAPPPVDGLAALARRLWEQTSGNPFFVTALVHHLVDTGAVRTDAAGYWSVDEERLAAAEVPRNVRDTVRRRVAACGEDVRDVLTGAAVLGAAIDAAAVGAVVDRPLTDVLHLLDEAERRGLVVARPASFGGYAFVHALVREVLYADLPTSVRVRLHTRAAAGTGRGDSAADVARHQFEAAQLGLDNDAVTWCRRAGDDAMAAGAWEQAEQQYGRALSIGGGSAAVGRTRVELLLALGGAQNLSGAVEEGRDSFLAAAEIARDIGEVELLAEAAIRYGGDTGIWVNGEDTTGPALVAEALAALPEEDSALRVRLRGREAHWRLFRADLRDTYRLAVDTVAMARRLGDDRLLLEALLDHHYSVSMGPATPWRHEASVEALALARRLGDDARLARALERRIADVLTTPDFVAADQLRAEMGAIAERRRLPHSQHLALAISSVIVAARGDLWEADDRARRSIESPGVGAYGYVIGHLQRAQLAILLGLHQPVAAGLRAAIGDPNPATRDNPGSLTPIVVASLEGDHDRARDLLVEWWESHTFLEQVGLFTNLLVEVVPLGGLDEIAREIYAFHRFWQGQWLTSLAISNPPADLLLGILARAFGDLPLAEEHLRVAAASSAAAAERPWGTWTNVELAEVVEARGGEATTVHAVATMAAAEARTMGLSRLLARAEAVLRRTAPGATAAAPIERRSMTVLVTDLVGSTRLRVALGEEAADELRRTHDALLGSVVEATHGRVVKGLGDGILALYPAASDALDAAVAIQDAVRAANASEAAVAEVEVRIGISSGDVSLEGGDGFGTPVVEASRLCSAAPDGGTLVADLTRATARGRGNHRFGPPQDLVLKGLPAPFVAVELVRDGPRAHPAPPPLPTADAAVLPPELAAPTPLPLVGRGAEREWLEAAWGEVAAHGSAVVVIDGESGAGKTRLAIELARHAAAEDGVVAFGRSDSDLDEPFAPWRSMIRQLLAAGGPVAPDLRRRLEPVLGVASVDRAPAIDRMVTLDAVAELLVHVSGDRRVLLVLDDLQWTDPSSALLLRHVLRAAPAAPVLVVATVRDGEHGRPSDLASLLHDVGRLARLEHLHLRPLVVEDVRPLVGDDAAARAICEQAGGNAFLVQELVRHQREAPDGIAAATPDGVRQVVEGRLAPLPPEARVDLVLAAVVGYELTLGVVAGASGRDELDVLDSFDVAVRRGLLVESAPDRFRFAHALVRTALLDGLSSSRRSRLHLAVAEAHVAAGSPASDIAHHYLACAGLGRQAEAAEWCLRAGEAAVAAHAWEQAAVHFEQAAAVAADAADLAATTGRAWFRAADASNAAGDPVRGGAAAVAAAAVARSTGDVRLLAEAALRYGGVTGYGATWMRPGDPVGPALVEEALAASGDLDDALRARLLARRASWMLFDTDPSARHELSSRAVDLAAGVGDDGVLAEVLSERYTALRGATAPSERLAVADELVALADRSGQTVREAWGLVCRTGALLNLGRLDDAAATLERLEWVVHHGDVASFRPRARGIASILATLEGRLDAADGLASDAVALSATDDHFSRILVGQQAVLAYLRGDLDRWAMLLDGDGFGPVFGFHVVRAAARGERAGGVAQLDEWAATWEPLLPESYVSVIVACLALAVPLLGDGAACSAAVLHQRLLPFAGTWVTSAEIAWPPADHALGLLAAAAGDVEGARHHHEAAVAMAEVAGEVVWREQARRALATP